MKEDNSYFIAPEQYELEESPRYSFIIDRRKFFKILGSGLVVTFTLQNTVTGALLTNDTNVINDKQINAWLHIGENNRITVFTGKVEVGQNIRTSLAQVVAEELRIPVTSIDMIMGDTNLTPYDRGTFGSQSTPMMGTQLRKAAASARELLVEMAAKEWKIDKSQVSIADGKVKNNKTKKLLTLSQLTTGKDLVKEVNNNVTLTPAENWTVAGTVVKKVNGEQYITGRHKYTSDLKLPGMLYGKVLRPVAFNATLTSVDVSKAAAIPGVVVIHDGNFVGTAAPDVNTAAKALVSIRAEWSSKEQPSRKEIFEYLVEHSSDGRDRGNQFAGNTKEALSKASIKQEQTFYIDYIAHAPLEPRAALAEWKDGKLTVWTGTQRPFGVQEELSHAFNLPKENIRVIMPDTGSGYGGKHTGEVAIEAARLAKAAQKPVKLVWTREEEFTWAYFRPAGVIEVKAGIDNTGLLTTWEFHNYNSGGSGIETPYEVPNKNILFHPADSPLRQGSYRGLAATANTFARESIMNDLATDSNIEPLEFRLKNLKNERMTAVLQAAAKGFGWSSFKPLQGHGAGIACSDEKGSYIATCAEVSVNASTNEIKVIRVVAAFECGAIINPAHLENQVQGSLVQGLGGALFEKIDFKNGKILNPLFSRYRVPRFKDIPAIEVILLDRKDIPPAGAGETPIMAIAPAIRNAVANATGKRLYSLPLTGGRTENKS